MKRPASTRLSHPQPQRLVARRTAQFLTAAVAVLATAHAPAAEPLYTNQPKFRIPFQFDAEEMARLRAVEIQLYVSTNQGRDWDLSQTVAPTETRFTFEAKSDALYWFTVSTLDARNQRHPPGPLQPGLQVVVDRTVPELELSLRESAPGEVALTWRADDEYLDIESLDLEFMDPNTAEWQPVAIAPAEEGRTSWSVPRTGRVLVRGSIADRAGNITSTEAAVVLGNARQATPANVRQAPPAPETPDFTQPVAENPADADELAGTPEPSTVRSSLPSFDQPLIRPIPLDGGEAPQIVSAPQQPADPVPAPHSFTAPSEPDPIPSATADIPRVNSTQFHLNYQLDGVGPAGVSEVKLYITEDGGRKWYVYGSDEDRQSPFRVEVPEDGLYGFVLRVQSGAGMAADPPQPGDEPEMSVVVDRQPPEVELLPVERVPGAAQPQVRIQWRVSDDKLAEQPVSLYYASRPTGPWEPITDWSENTGEYTWNLGESVPSRLFVRVEARDAAGNLARADSRSPLVMQTTRPTARIVDVESIERTEPPR